MALILLVLIGLLVGWFASIIARVEEGPAIRRLMAASLVASLVIGLLVNSGTFLGSLSWLATGAAFLAGAAASAGYRYFISRQGA